MITTRLFVCGLLLASGAVAQTVYESKGSKGRVFSDQPMPGGKPVELPPLNIIEAVPVPPATPKGVVEEAKPAPALPAYRSLTVVFPEAGGSVAANYATFEVRVSIDPPLLISKGHAFKLRLDGRPVPGRYTATEMMVPPEFFGDVMPAGVQRHVLEVSVVDEQGGTLLTSAAVDFQTRFVNVLQRPHRLAPSYPAPVPKPEPKPEPKPAAKGARILEPSPDSRPVKEMR
jgi:Domain of unknown function (DUF4124)